MHSAVQPQIDIAVAAAVAFQRQCSHIITLTVSITLLHTAPFAVSAHESEYTLAVAQASICR
jgi:hypothetical protein